MKLLLDAHIAPRVAEQLRGRGFAVVAAGEAGLLDTPDPDVLAWAVSERRAIVTRNVRDFRPLHAIYLSRGDRHYGMIFLARAELLRSGALGELVEAIATVLENNRSDEALMLNEWWVS